MSSEEMDGHADQPAQDRYKGVKSEGQSSERQANEIAGISIKSFVHQPLDTTTEQIRLLKVFEGHDSDVEGFIQRFYLGSAPQYRALSYTWDHESPWTSIILNEERHLRIRQSLKHFLLLFRQRHPNQYIWIDQICIDQKTKEEKNHQVSMMSRIYSTALEVLIWLPARNLDLDEAVMRRPADIIASYKKEHGHEDIWRIAKELQPFTSHPYWGRTWIIQEIWFAKHIDIFWCDQIITWKAFCDFFWKAEIFWAKQAFFASLHGPNRLTQMSTTSAGVFSTILHVRKTVCEDPRGKWYGIQGLISEEFRTPINYGEEPEAVFLSASLAIMTYYSGWIFILVVLDLAYAMQLMNTTDERGLVRNSFYGLYGLEREPERYSLDVLKRTQQALREGDSGMREFLRPMFLALLTREGVADLEGVFEGMYCACVQYYQDGLAALETQGLVDEA